MTDDIKSFLIKEIGYLSEKIRNIEDDSKSSGVDFLSDSRYIYLIGKRDFAKHILNYLKNK